MLKLAHTPERAPATSASRVDQAIADGKVPVDRYGMPYLLHPGQAHIEPGEFWDDDHSFFFSSAKELTKDTAGRALRLSRVQHVPRWIHNRKHNVFFRNGVEELPQTESSKFALTVLACAGYTSRTALDLRGDEPRLVRMSDRVYDFVRGKQQLHPEIQSGILYDYRTTERSLKTIGLFFAEYIKKQNLGDIVKKPFIDEFLNTEDDDIRRKRGNFIIRQAIIHATDIVEPKYQKALKKQLVRPRIKSAKGVVATVFPFKEWHMYHDELAKQLRAA